jgi:hypothetical protein
MKVVDAPSTNALIKYAFEIRWICCSKMSVSLTTDLIRPSDVHKLLSSRSVIRAMRFLESISNVFYKRHHSSAELVEVKREDFYKRRSLQLFIMTVLHFLLILGIVLICYGIPLESSKKDREASEFASDQDDSSRQKRSIFPCKLTV